MIAQKAITEAVSELTAENMLFTFHDVKILARTKTTEKVFHQVVKDTVFDLFAREKAGLGFYDYEVWDFEHEDAQVSANVFFPQDKVVSDYDPEAVEKMIVDNGRKVVAPDKNDWSSITQPKIDVSKGADFSKYFHCFIDSNTATNQCSDTCSPIAHHVVPVNRTAVYLGASNKITIPNILVKGVGLKSGDDAVVMVSSVKGLLVIAKEEWKGHEVLGHLQVDKSNNIRIGRGMLLKAGYGDKKFYVRGDSAHIVVEK